MMMLVKCAHFFPSIEKNETMSVGEGNTAMHMYEN